MSQAILPGGAPAGRKGLDTDEVRRRLRARHEWPEWLFFEEVPFDGPDGRMRLADAIALPTYQSRGYVVHGFEVKVTRSDWLREMADMSKAEAIAKDVDRFWLVLGDPAIALEEEVPPAWGILAPHGDGLKVRRQAKQLRPEDCPLPRRFLVTLARKAQKHADDRSEEHRRTAFDRGYAQGKLEALREHGYAPAKAEAYGKLAAAILEHPYLNHRVMDDQEIAEVKELVRVGRLVLGNRWDGLDRLPGLLEKAAKEVGDALRENARRVRDAVQRPQVPP